MALVSVIMPVYNDEENVLSAINSVINQTYQNWELIIVDDCSNDQTNNIIKDYIKDCQNIKLIRNKTNIGCYASTNVGIEYAKGMYITRIDSDDVFVRTKLSLQVNFIKKHPQVWGCFTHYTRNGVLKSYGFITLMFKKKLIDNIGYFDNVRFGADTEFIERIYKVYGKYAIGRVKKILYNASLRENSLTTNPLTGSEENSVGYLLRQDYIKKFTEWHNSEEELYMPYNQRPFDVDRRML